MQPASQPEADETMDAFGDQPATRRRRTLGIATPDLDDAAEPPGDPRLRLEADDDAERVKNRTPPLDCWPGAGCGTAPAP